MEVMPQTYLDDEAFQILKDTQEEMKKSGILGATLGDAVRRLKKGYEKSLEVIGEQGKNADALNLALA
jgi:hypothetical protein